MPPFDLFVVPFLTLPILVWLLDATAGDPVSGIVARFRRGIATGFWFGFGFFAAGLWWIGFALLVEADRFAVFLPLAVVALPTGLAVFWGIACGIAITIWRDGWQRIFWLAAWLAAAEYARGFLFTGFPWNQLGMAAMPFSFAMQSASLIGSNGVTLAAIPVFAILAAGPFDRLGARVFAGLCAAALAAHLGFGIFRMAQLPLSPKPGVMLRLVQPAISQDEKWTAEFADRSFRKLLDLSAGAPSESGLAGIDLLAWPESAFAFVLTERADALAAIAELLPDETLLATGALRLDRTAGKEPPPAYNSIYLIDADGGIAAASDKAHLVPFGEYLPFAELLAGFGIEQIVHAQGGFQAGRLPAPVKAGRAGNLLPLVCYEAIFPGLIRQSPRPDFILNLTNDAWFGKTPGPYQHWRQAILRGVEFGLPVVRVANSGVSSVSDPLGRIIAKLPLGAAGHVDSPLPEAGLPTFYAIYGERPFLAMLILFAAIGLAAPWHPRRPKL